LKTNDRLPLKLHGMEEVVGSSPTRSTNSRSAILNQLLLFKGDDFTPRGLTPALT
jgi:hypothetical protein